MLVAETEAGRAALAVTTRDDTTEADAQPGSPMLRAHRLNAWFGRNRVLRNVTLDFGDRAVTAVIGPSGCGKSTLLRCLNRMHETVPEAAVEGDVFLGERKRRRAVRVESGERQRRGFPDALDQLRFAQHEFRSGRGQRSFEVLTRQLGMHQRQRDAAASAAQERRHLADRVLPNQRDHIARAGAQPLQALRSAQRGRRQLRVAQPRPAHLER